MHDFATSEDEIQHLKAVIDALQRQIASEREHFAAALAAAGVLPDAPEPSPSSYDDSRIREAMLAAAKAR